MATVTSSSIILQPLSTLSGTYPSSTDGSNGFTTVTVNYGDTVVVPLRSGSTGTAAGTSNYGNTPNGNTGTGGTFVSPSTSFSSSNQTINVTISNIQYDGLISFWCGPSDGGSSVGWRGRVQVNVNLDTSINLNSSSVSINSADTSYANGLTNGGAGTIYYVLNVNNYANGSNINSLFTGSDSRYIARTFTAATSKPFSTDGVTSTITNDLPTSTSKTFYVYAANLLGQNSQYLGTSYAVSVAVTPPNVSATKAIITNGFKLFSNPTGTTSGTVTYQWSTTGGGPNSKSSYSTGYTSNQDLGVGTEWVGTTWTCQARATTDGSTFVYSGTSSTTLPTYSVTAPTSIQEGTQGTFSNSSTNGLGPIYYQVTTASGGDFATSTGQIFTSSFGVTPTSDGITEGNETATVKLYINNTFNSSNYIYAEDTFLITDPPVVPTAPVVNNTQTFATTASPTTTCTIALTSSGTNGTLEYNVTTSTTVPTSGWQTSATVTVSRGTAYYFWARRAVGYEDRTDSAITVPYLPLSDNTITIGTPTDKNGTALSTNVSGVYIIPNSYGTSAGDNINIPYTQGGSGDQYRILSNNAQNAWLDTRTQASSTFVLEMNSSSGSYSELPPAGTTWDYYFEGRRLQTAGGAPDPTNTAFVSVTSSPVLKLFRENPPASYTVSASPTSINEGQSTTYTVTYSNIPSARTVNYAITGITSDDLSSGNLSGSFSISSGSGTATTSITLANDNLTDGSETATLTLASTDSTGASTGTPSASVTIADTSTAGSGGSGDDLQSGLTAGTYGLQIKNIAGTTTIIDDVSRIGTFLATATITFTSGGTNPQPAFAGFDCSSSSVTGLFINNWTGSAWLSPSITRSSNGISVARNPSTSGGVYGSCVLYLIRY
jgi:hypothetical protein